MLLSLPLAGCSIVTLDRYYAPDLPKIESYRDTHCAASVLAGGAGEVALLNHDLISFNVRQKHQKISLITAGPLYFPIIPAFPLTWIFPDKYPQDYVDLRITVTSLSNDLLWNLRTMKVVLPDGREIVPTAYETGHRDFTTPIDSAIPLTVPGKLWFFEKKPSAFSYTFWVRYPFDPEHTMSFKLDFGNIRVGTDTVSFPQLTFVWSKGWSYCFVP